MAQERRKWCVNSRLSVIAILVVLCTSTFAGQTRSRDSRGRAAGDWLPPEAAEHAASLMTGRLVKLGLVADEVTGQTLARFVVDALRIRLTTLGESGVVQRAPDMSHLGLPPANHVHIDALARYFMCAVSFEVLHARGAFAKAPKPQRREAALAAGSFTVVGGYLGYQYVAATGGTEQQIRAFMIGEAMEQITSRMQDNAEVLGKTYDNCRPTLVALLGD